MRYVSMTHVSDGMILAKPILDETGRILLGINTVLTNPYITRLITLGVSGIYIDDALSSDIEIEEPISPKLRGSAIAALKEHDIDSCIKISRDIVNEIINSNTTKIDMKDLRTYDNYTYEHSISVAVLACTMGLHLKLKENMLYDLVLAGILHDIGKTEIPPEVLNKPEHLTPEEYALIKAHPTMSYDIIKDNTSISALCKNAVISHHENHDGSGYPNHAKGENITLLARILHVADVYDALVSQRPYKKPYSPFAAVELLQGGSGTSYHPDAVNAFLESVPLYPKGTLMEIDGSIEGIVIENSGIHNMRPIIRVAEGIEIDLASPENKEMVITSPGDSDHFRIMAEEEERKQMFGDVKRYTVMVVDINTDTFEELSKKLSQIYDFVYAPTERHAESIIKKTQAPDLILFDIDLISPENMSEHISKMQHICENRPSICLGSKRDLTTISALKSGGVKSYVLKPYSTIYLQSQIKLFTK